MRIDEKKLKLHSTQILMTAKVYGQKKAELPRLKSFHYRIILIGTT